jgi:hypothetical protein
VRLSAGCGVLLGLLATSDAGDVVGVDQFDLLLARLSVTVRFSVTISLSRQVRSIGTPCLPTTTRSGSGAQS